MALKEGTRLLVARFEAAGQTKTEFGATNGVDTPSYMNRLLSGQRMPGRALASRWVETLGIPITAWDEDVADDSGEHPAVEGHATPFVPTHEAG